ncbi:hypothetical protein CSB08_00450 [Candidatus Gracilibacteria bacterium]|nr:MAG: hypothetical protein CSB08_00450 [Candidatus Gracilibacteria bacterium]PIE85312.1 MAG: hypothetical protein CSA08_02800 [Candidatus Gracilibacteria bacterium]
MNKLKIIIFFIIFTILHSKGYAINIEINSEKNKVNVGETFNLNINIEGDLSEDNKLKKISGIENFNIISKSQSQQSSSKLVIINGKQKRKSKNIYSIMYSLQAIKEGVFTIGPIEINNSGTKISSLPLKIEVFGEKNIEEKINIKTEKNKDDFIYKQKKIIKNIIIVSFIIALLIGIYFYFKNKGKINKIKSLLKKEEKKEVIKNPNPKKTNYPKIEEKDFIYKLEKIFKNKLENKYKIKNVKNKTYIDILSEIENIDSHNKEKIETLSDLFNKAKYSKIRVNKDKLLKLVKEIK